MSHYLEQYIVLHIDNNYEEQINQQEELDDVFELPGIRYLQRELRSESKLDHLTVSFPKVEIVELSQKDIIDVKRDPRAIGAAALPLSLIKPVSKRIYKSKVDSTTTWGIETILANKSELNGKGVKVAVLDTGIKSDHVAFEGVNLNIKNFTEEVDEDIDGHGTHCAGTIFGRNVNGMRIGVAPGITEALVGKVIGVGGSSASLIEAINWAYKEGANIISMSLGIDFTKYIEYLESRGYSKESATSYALEQYANNVTMFSNLSQLISSTAQLYQPCTIIAASGNSSNRPHYKVSASVPATSENIISVGALKQTRKKLSIAPFSNNRCVIGAPGVNITSAWINSNDSLMSLDGTSMAVPHVAGCAALWIQKLNNQKNFSSKMLEAQLLGNCMHLPEIQSDDIGAGLVQAPLSF